MTFLDKLLTASRKNDSLLCIGLDPEPDKLPQSLQHLDLPSAYLQFCRAIIEATAPYACAYKPNLGFFEALGPSGLIALEKIVSLIPLGIPVIADAKRGDIGNTAKNYATAIFDFYGFDAVTINPYLGQDSVEPFLERKDKGTLLLCRTSNPGARDFQDLPIQGSDGQTRPLYQEIAHRVQTWNTNNNAGLVVGATYPQELQTIRAIAPTMPILIPGVGAQGGDLPQSVKAGIDANGELAVISVSRTIIFASSNDDFAEAAAAQAKTLRAEINKSRRHHKKSPT